MTSSLKLIFAAAASVSLCACASLTFEPSPVGAEHECASHSAHLADYNACMARVDAEYRDYELQKKLDEEDDG